MAATPGDDIEGRLRTLFAALDWRALGEVYCDEGGEAFWHEHREPVLQLGLRWARALARRVPRGGRSLHVGAGVAELPVLVVEVVELGREVFAANRRAGEVELLQRGLDAAGVDVRWHPDDAARPVAIGRFDHIGLVSVATDPETFPAVSAVTYGRLHAAMLDVEAFAAERESLRGLFTAVLDRLTTPGVVTTTVEEVPWVLEWARSRGRAVEADDEVFDTAVVGDPLGFLAISAGGS